MYILEFQTATEVQNNKNMHDNVTAVFNAVVPVYIKPIVHPVFYEHAETAFS